MLQAITEFDPGILEPSLLLQRAKIKVVVTFQEIRGSIHVFVDYSQKSWGAFYLLENDFWELSKVTSTSDIQTLLFQLNVFRGGEGVQNCVDYQELWMKVTNNFSVIHFDLSNVFVNKSISKNLLSCLILLIQAKSSPAGTQRCFNVHLTFILSGYNNK